MAVTWNPSDKGAAITLSGGNLIVGGGGGGSSDAVRATVSKSTGKWYWEYTATANTGLLGVANATYSITGSSAISSPDALIIGGTGVVFHNSTNLGTISGGAIIAGDIISIAFDAGAGTVAFRRNNGTALTISGANVPTGALFPLVASGGSALNVTANFGTVSTTYSPPAGYTPLDGVSNDINVAMTELTLDAGTNDFVQVLPAITVSADGFAEPGFAADIPALTLVAVAETLPYATLVLPAMTMAAVISDTASLAEQLPALTLTAQVQSGEVTTVTAALPALTLSSGTGASSDLAMAPLTLDATAYPGALSTIAVTLLPLSVDATASQAEVWTATLTLPALACDANLAAGNTATLDLSMPALTSAGTVLSGSVATLLEALPLLESEGTAHGESVNTMSATLPALTVLADAIAAVSTALGDAWVMNLRNSALTQYTNFGFNSMTLFNGKYLGASDAGIVELGTLGTASGDAGTQIDASARTGSLDSDSSFMKRAPYLYVQCEADGDMVVSKVSAEHGQRDFLLPWSGREGMQQRRVKTGRKSKSEFWQWEFSNRLGSYVRVASFDAMAQRTGRRVQ